MTRLERVKAENERVNLVMADTTIISGDGNINIGVTRKGLIAVSFRKTAVEGQQIHCVMSLQNMITLRDSLTNSINHFMSEVD